MGLVYVTGNYGKYLTVKEKFESNNLDIDFKDIDIKELDINDIEKISMDKAKQAYALYGVPCFAMDSGFYIENYPDKPGYPGAFAKRSGVTTDVTKLLDTMKDVKNRSCYFKDCLTYYDGKKYYKFYGISKGNLSTSIRGELNNSSWSNIWTLFIPINYDKTLAEMSDYERNHRKDGNISAVDEFIKWYKDNN